MNTCPAGIGNESCCASLEVPGGTYYRTYDLWQSGADAGPSADGGWPDKADPATVSGFRLDEYLVTVGRFRQFVAAWNNGAGYLPPAGSGKHTHLNGGLGLVNVGSDAGLQYETGWVEADDSNIAPTDANLLNYAGSTWTAEASTQENLPINCVNWWESYAFCIWDGGFLPSEAEWEYAAAGGSEQREYPWGSTDPGTDNQYAIYGGYNNIYNPLVEGRIPGVAPVGFASQGVARWGQLDMAGNLFQWSLDWYAAYVDRCTDCAFLTGTSSRVVRTSDFTSDLVGLEPPFRFFAGSTVRGVVGFRCARTP